MLHRGRERHGRRNLTTGCGYADVAPTRRRGWRLVMAVAPSDHRMFPRLPDWRWMHYEASFIRIGGVHSPLFTWQLGTVTVTVRH